MLWALTIPLLLRVSSSTKDSSVADEKMLSNIKYVLIVHNIEFIVSYFRKRDGIRVGRE